MIKAIRSVDDESMVIIEPSFWGSSYGLKFIDGQVLQDLDPLGNIAVSPHFYEPRVLTWSHSYCSDGSIRFPGEIPVYPWIKWSETENWTENVSIYLREF